MSHATMSVLPILFGCALLTTGCLGSTSDAKSGSSGDFDECPSGLIEDFEDGDAQILAQDGRGGYWYPEADEDGTTITPDGEFEPSDGGAQGSKRAGHVQGKTADGKNVWAGMGFTFANPKQPYDASKYKAISFRARRGKTGTPIVIVRMPDAQTDPEGGECKDCWNDFGTKLTLGEDWKKFVLPFDELQQEPGWGEQKTELATTKLFGLKFQIKARNLDYDIWVDDIRFVGCRK
jgi:endoglucanase